MARLGKARYGQAMDGLLPFTNMVETDLGLELNLTRHCNFHCCNCNHASAFADAYTMTPDVVRRDVGVMKDHLKVKLFMAQGGEPTLNKHLVEILGIMYDAQMARQCGVLSNGSRLKKMGDDLWEMLATRKMELRLSIYPDLDPSIVPFALEMGQKWGFFVRPQEINSFKPVFASVPDGRTYHGCPWNRCLTIHENFFFLCPLSAFWPEQFMRREEKWKDISSTVDGIEITGMTDERLQEFLNRRHPLESCKICSGGRGPDIPHHQNRSKEEWELEAGIQQALA